MIEIPTVSHEDATLIISIAKRASKHYKLNVLDIAIDLTITHSFNPLRLHDLLKAVPYEFCHDIFGIHDNLDHNTGKLNNFFSPRFSV